MRDIGEIIAGWSSHVGWTWFDATSATRQDATIPETNAHTVDFVSDELHDIMVETEEMCR